MTKKDSLTILLLILVIIMSAYIALQNKGFMVADSYNQVIEPTNLQTTTIDKSTKHNYPPNPIPKNQTRLYFEEINNPYEFLVGSAGNQYRLIGSSTVPATVTYTLKFNTYPSAPNAVLEDYTINKTILLPVGVTSIGKFTSVDNPTVTYSII